MKGDSANAMATAREAMQLDAERGQFELAEVLASLDRLEEARFELERVRAAGASKGDVDRRLALLAFQAGDYAEAQRRFTDLATSEDATDAVLLYLADIAERDGDIDTALAGYRRLVNSPALEMTARTRGASILLKKKERGQALALLDDYLLDHPDKGFEITVTKANLLADNGEIDGGLALLSAALDQHPQHPAIQYDRAVMLEKAGRVKDSVSALEKLLADRADDPTLLNALGYTLADHGLELSRAEGLIKKSLAVMPDNPAVLDSLGWVRFKRGDSKGAAESLRRAYLLAHDPEIAAHLAEALWKGGSQQEARAVLAAALARHPDLGEVEADGLAARTSREDLMRLWLAASPSASPFALAGCKTLPPAPSAPAGSWEARRAALQARDSFDLSGRIAVAAAQDGFNAKLRWQQQGELSQLALDGPLGVGGVRITAKGNALTVLNCARRAAR